jgi:polyhydroxyalkanoate synthase subunit PhaE
VNAPLDPLGWQAATERAYGAFADALGLRTWRELAHAMQTVASRQADEWLALVEYLQVLGQAWADAMQSSAARLGEGSAQGQQLDSAAALLKVWTTQLDAAMHAALQSEPGLRATAAAVSATAHRRIEMQRIVELQSQALGMPTRSELDDAFREIQQLKRELRQLKRATDARMPEAST